MFNLYLRDACAIDERDQARRGVRKRVAQPIVHMMAPEPQNMEQSRYHQLSGAADEQDGALDKLI
ncbi:MAG: hypothetical protein ACOH2N_15570 [Devosia sp.]